MNCGRHLTLCSISALLLTEAPAFTKRLYIFLGFAETASTSWSSVRSSNKVGFPRASLGQDHHFIRYSDASHVMSRLSLRGANQTGVDCRAQRPRTSEAGRRPPVWQHQREHLEGGRDRWIKHETLPWRDLESQHGNSEVTKH